MKKRVRIPTNPGLIVALVKQVKGKHTADGSASALEKLNWAVLAPEIDDTVA